MKIFVAGGTGVLGRASLPPMARAGHKVISTARDAATAKLVKDLGAEPTELNLYDAVAVRNAIRGCDAVIRLATKVPPFRAMRNRSSWEENSHLRTTVAQILVDAALAAGTPIYIHESVTFVYANGDAAWLDEDAPADDGQSRILTTALQGESHAARFTQSGRSGIVLRFAALYGPDAPSTRDMAKLATRRKLCHFGHGTNYFSSIYATDAGQAIFAALDLPPGIYNGSDDVPVTLGDYQSILARCMKAPQPFRLPNALGRWILGDVWNCLSRSHRVSNQKLKACSRWTPRVRSVSDGWPIIAAGLAVGM